MSITEYIRELQKQKEAAQARFENLGEMELEFLDNSYDWLLENLELKGGRFVVEDTLYQQMNRFVQAVVKIANDSKIMTGKVSKFLADAKVIENNLIDYHATENHIDVKKLQIRPEQKIFVDEMIDMYKGNGLNVHFAEPLKDSVYRNMFLGLDLKGAKRVLGEYIMSGQDKSGKLGRYLLQTAQQGVDSYAGMINKKLVETYEFDGYYVTGSIIDNSEPQCIAAIEAGKKNGGFVTNEQMQAILNKYAKGLVKGTTLKNLPLNKLHWGCRHEFTPGYN